MRAFLPELASNLRLTALPAKRMRVRNQHASSAAPARGEWACTCVAGVLRSQNPAPGALGQVNPVALWFYNGLRLPKTSAMTLRNDLRAHAPWQFALCAAARGTIYRSGASMARACPRATQCFAVGKLQRARTRNSERGTRNAERGTKCESCQGFAFIPRSEFRVPRFLGCLSNSNYCVALTWHPLRLRFRDPCRVALKCTRSFAIASSPRS